MTSSHLPTVLTGDSQKEPWLLRFRSSRIFIIATVSMAIFTDIFLYAVIVPVIPFALRERAGVPDDETQYWVSVLLAVYAAALLAASPPSGWLSDRITNRRVPFLAGLLMLAGATVFLAIGNSIALLIIGRVLQGISAAVSWTVGLAVMVDTVGKQNDIGEALGYVAMAMSIGLLCGPLLGGIVFDQAGYIAVFAMCFGLLGTDIVCRLLMIERKVAKKWIPLLDSRRPSISTLSQRSRPGSRGESQQKSPARDRSTSTTLCDRNTLANGNEGKAEARDKAYRSAGAKADEVAQPQHLHRNSATPSLAAAAKAALAKRSTRNKLPPILTLLTSRRLLAALYASLVQAALFTAFDSTLPIRVRNIFGWNSLGAGLIFLPLVVPTFIAPVFGKLSDRYGPRWFCFAGFLLCCPFLVLLRIPDHNTLSQKVILCVLLALLGLSISVAFPALMAEITYTVELKERRAPEGAHGKNGAYAQAYALFNMFYAGGCIIGPIWGGMVKEHAGWNTMCWTLGLLSAVTAIPCALLTGGWIGHATKWEKRSNDSALARDDEDLSDAIAQHNKACKGYDMKSLSAPSARTTQDA